VTVADDMPAADRSARQVVADHLRLRRAGDLERDLRENFAPDVVVLTAREVFRGHDGVRASAHRLWKALAGGTYSYDYVLVDERMGLLEWGGRTDDFQVRCGVDSFLVDGGLIRAQTIHYEVVDSALSTSGGLMAYPGEDALRPVPDPARMTGLTDG
jgi:hypothetical protein